MVALSHDAMLVGQSGLVYTYICNRCGITWNETSPIEPPIVEVSLELDEGEDSRVLVETVVEEHQYLYAGNKLLQETIISTTNDGAPTTQTLDFLYDSVGKPYALMYTVGSTTQTYYYITNLQGDVMYLVDENGNEVAAYSYDPYGKLLSSSGVMAEVNPIRYRGYCYDSDSGFYYLQSRYYDPEICRFINADSYASTGQGLIGYNMFSYCGNDPISYKDSHGNFAWAAALPAIIGGAAVGGLINLASYMVACGINDTEPTFWCGLEAFGVGALTGGIGGGAGLVATTSAKLALSGVNASITLIVTCKNTDGSWLKKAAVGGVASIISFGSTFLGANVPTDEMGAMANGFVTACYTWSVNTWGEIVNVFSQTWIGSLFIDLPSCHEEIFYPNYFASDAGLYGSGAGGGRVPQRTAMLH